MNKDVSIIFVNYKTKDLTINAIKSVYEKTEGINFEIFVVDNNSQDGSIEAIEEEFPQINIIRNPVNSGFGAANNLAIKQANGKYILCLNTDTLLVNNAIKIMFDFMEKEENCNVGVCGGYVQDTEGNPINCGGNLPSLTEVFWKLGLRNLFQNYYNNKYKISINSLNCDSEIGYITGADIMFRKSVLNQIGIFDENFFMYYEETDLCYRIKKEGFHIKYLSAAKIIHFEGKSCVQSLNRKKQTRISEFYYFKKHFGNSFLFIKIIYCLLYIIDSYILKNKESRELLKLVITL